MKKIYVIFIFLASFFNFQHSFSQCTPTFNNGCSIALDNLWLYYSPTSTTLIDDSDTGCSGPSSSGVVNVTAGASYYFELSVSSSSGSDNSSAFFSIWLDKNNDGDFEDAGERLYYNNSTEIYKLGYGDPEYASGKITIPLDAVTGTNLKFRVLVVAANDLGETCNTDPSDACGTYCGGEIHDYTFNVAEAPICPLTFENGCLMALHNFSLTSVSPAATLINDVATACSGPASSSVVNVTAGENYNFDLTVYSAGGSDNTSAFYSIWLDKNNDGVFDTAERLFYNNTTEIYKLGYGPPESASGSITIPSDALTGTDLKFRVLVVAASGLGETCNTDPSDACGTYCGGEAHDYTFNIAAPPCTTPDAPTLSYVSACAGTSVTLTATCTTGTPNWYESSTATTALASGSYTINNIAAPGTTYYVSCETSATCASNRMEQSTVVSENPTAPTAVGTEICSGTTAALAASCSSGIARWYESNTSSSILGSTSYTTPILSGNTSYYVACESGESPTCVSTRTLQSIQVNGLVTPPTASGQTICSGSTASLTASCAEGTTVKWYSDITGGTFLGTGTYTTPTLTDNTSYFVECAKNYESISCSSTRTEVLVTVSNTSPPTANGQNICSGSTAALTASCPSGTAKWYESDTSITVLATGSYTTPVLTNTTNYYVACESGGSPNCISERTTQTVQVNDLPSPPTASGKEICSGLTASLSASCSEGSTVMWYSAITGGTFLGTGTYTTPTLTTPTSYFVECERNYESVICHSTRVEVLVTVNPNPTIPKISSNTTLICNAETATLQATGCNGTVKWSNTSTGTSITVSSSGTYTAVCENGCGTSENSNTIIIDKSTTPSAPLVLSNKATLCDGEFATLTASGCSGVVTWNNTSTGTSISVSVAGTYNATCTNVCGPSGNSDNIIIKTGQSPTLPTINLASPILCGETNKTLIATGCNGSINWSNGSTNSSINVTSSGTYGATCETICGISSQTTINIQFLVNPTAAASNTGPYELGQKIQLSGSGGPTYTWRGPDDFLSTNADVSILNASLADGGVYTLTVTNPSGCSATATTNVVMNPCSQLFKFDYVKAGTAFQFLFPITDGMKIAALPIYTGIIATPICQLDTVSTQSVRLQMTGPEPLFNRDILEKIYPYSPFENRGFQVFGPIFPPGEYTLITTGYSKDNPNDGIITFGPQTLHFTIIANSLSILLTDPNLTQICAGSSFNVGFETTGTFSEANKFEVQISDANGSFEFPIKIGERTTAGIVNCQIPANLPAGNGYKIRIFSTNPALMSSTFSGVFVINPRSITLQSPDNDISTIITQKATEKITATNKVFSEGKATYEAGRFILLQPGFVVNSSGVFKAEIKGCTE